MKIIKEITITSIGTEFIKTDPDYDLFGIYLTTEIRSDYSYNLIKTKVGKAEAFDEWDGSGNAFTIYITPEKVIVELFADESYDTQETDHDSFLEALETWFSYLTEKRKKEEQS